MPSFESSKGVIAEHYFEVCGCFICSTSRRKQEKIMEQQQQQLLQQQQEERLQQQHQQQSSGQQVYQAIYEHTCRIQLQASKIRKLI